LTGLLTHIIKMVIKQSLALFIL